MGQMRSMMASKIFFHRGIIIKNSMGLAAELWGAKGDSGRRPKEI